MLRPPRLQTLAVSFAAAGYHRALAAVGLRRQMGADVRHAITVTLLVVHVGNVGVFRALRIR